MNSSGNGTAATTNMQKRRRKKKLATFFLVGEEVDIFSGGRPFIALSFILPAVVPKKNRKTGKGGFSFKQKPLKKTTLTL